MRLAIASGKGGTGKTTVASNLAAYLQSTGEEVTMVDCDVEEPNSHYFLQTSWEQEIEQTVPVPKIDEQTCLGESCQKCAQECRFNALIWMVSSILVFPELCHSCGLCATICPVQAVSETTRTIGVLRWGDSKGIKLYGGLLRIGEAMAPPLIKRVKAAAPQGTVQIIDAPPGTSCPVIEALSGADMVVLVAEPTPFGLHDLKLTVDLMLKLKFPFGVVINRDGMGDERLEAFLTEKKIPILAKLPHLKEAASAYSKGQLLIDVFPDFREEFSRMWSNIMDLAHGEGRLVASRG